MGKAPEVDIARAQLKLLIVHGNMQKMEAYPVAYYNIVKTKDGVACRPVAQEVIGRAAFLLAYAAIVYAYVVHFWLPFITWVYGENSHHSAPEYILALILPSLPLVTLVYNVSGRLRAWYRPASIDWLDKIKLGVNASRINTPSTAYMILPDLHKRDGIHSFNDPVYKLTAYLCNSVAWFFLIGTLEGLSLVITAVLIGVVFIDVFDFSQQARALWIAQWICVSATALFIGLSIARMRVWKLVNDILENEPAVQTSKPLNGTTPESTSLPGVHIVGQPYRSGRRAVVQPPPSERLERAFFPHYSLAGMILWGLFLLAKYLYNLGKDKRPEK